MAREEEIRIIAYRIWQEEGCQHGHDHEHWRRAEAMWQHNQKQLVLIKKDLVVKGTGAGSKQTVKPKAAPKQTAKPKQAAKLKTAESKQTVKPKVEPKQTVKPKTEITEEKPKKSCSFYTLD